MLPITLTRVAFASNPTRSQHDLILQALQGWGDPEQLTDTEAVEMKRLCVKWFGLKKTVPFTLLMARMWKDAIVFSSVVDLGTEHAIVIQDNEDSIILYRVNRGHRLIPAEHCALQYLKHVIDVAVDECVGDE
jgi:hypothetical protein